MQINKFVLNKIQKDEFGRISGILVLNKESGITSHDLVDRVRRRLKTRKVGHAGALDPFATGLMLILVGKATKLSQQLLNLDKEYLFDVLLGISTNTQDPEGSIVNISEVKLPLKTEIKKILESFTRNYKQTVPVFSSIRVGGVRLRELAHASSNISKKGKIVTFKLNGKTRLFKSSAIRKKITNSNEITLKLPERLVEIKNINLIKSEILKGKNIQIKSHPINSSQNFPILTIHALVSKGTYIRQLAEDIGVKLGNIPSMLYKLHRTRIGKIGEKNICKLNTLI